MNGQNGICIIITNMGFKEKLISQYPLTESDWQTARQFFTIETIKMNGYFLAEGNIPEKMGIVRSGLLRSFINDAAGNEVTTRFFEPGSVVISPVSFNNRIPADENIVALDDTEIVTVTYSALQELYRVIPCWSHICRDLADAQNEELVKRTLQLQTLKASERYNLFCRKHPEVLKKVALRHIASYLGIDIATLSRIRSKK